MSKSLPKDATILSAFQQLMGLPWSQMPLKDAKRIFGSLQDCQPRQGACGHDLQQGVHDTVRPDERTFEAVILECQRWSKTETGILNLWIGQCKTCGQVFWDAGFQEKISDV